MISIVIPTYRERENLEPLVSQLSDVMAVAGHSYEILIVDDDSQDGTEEEVQEHLTKYPVRLIVRRGQRGLSTAVLHGFNEARGDILVCMDADLSHPPDVVPRMISRLDEEAVEFVMASRYVSGGSTDEGWGLSRWLNSKVATLMARPFARVTDPMSGCFALRRSVYEQAEDLNPIGYKVGLELLVKCGCANVAEVPFHFSDRRLGHSKLNLRERLNYLRHLKRLADFKFGVLSKFAQFCAVGMTGMLVDVGAFVLLTSLSLSFPLARAVAILVAMTWNFILNRWITFSRSPDGNLLRQYAKFVATCSVGGLLNWAVSTSLVAKIGAFQRTPILAVLLGIAAGTVFNFLISRRWVFGNRS